MDLATIDVDQGLAQQKLDEYRGLVSERMTEEDRALRTSYEALAKGRSLIRLGETLRRGGVQEFDEPMRSGRVGRPQRVQCVVPRLAVAAADHMWCWTFGLDDRGAVEFRWQREFRGDARRVTRKRMVVRAVAAHEPERRADLNWDGESSAWAAPRIRSHIPYVPPALRPARGLGRYHVLWEAEWGLDPVPPVDPALIRHVVGDLYAVVATWDLTPLEQAVLAERPAE